VYSIPSARNASMTAWPAFIYRVLSSATERTGAPSARVIGRVTEREDHPGIDAEWFPAPHSQAVATILADLLERGCRPRQTASGKLDPCCSPAIQIPRNTMAIRAPIEITTVRTATKVR
jgi:hypothetical protein